MAGLRFAILISLCTVVLLGYPFQRVTSCQFENSAPLRLNKKSTSYVPICFVFNDRSLVVAEVKFDVLSRVIIRGSFAAVSAPNACESNKFWFPLGCNWNAAGLYSGSGLGSGAPTNLYAKVLGQPSIYKKRYVGISRNAISSVFPLLTLVVEVDKGVVTKVYWDDNCYFNEGGSTANTEYTNMNCRSNAFDLRSNNATSTRFLNPSGAAESPIGYDTAFSVASCQTNIETGEALPSGFCDLGVYIVWTGTSSDGQQLVSAGQRFKRFRDYAMNNQYLTVSSLRVVFLLTSKSVNRLLSSVGLTYSQCLMYQMLNFTGHVLPEPVVEELT